MNTIYIAIASYIDYEIRYTILDCISKAKYPENLYFSVCLQYDENTETSENCIDDLQKICNLKIDKFHYTNSEGGCWARNIAQQNYNGEKYSLQIDSHTRFIRYWDEIIINDYNNLLKETTKPLLSFLPPSYSRIDKIGIDIDFKHLYDLDRIHIPKIDGISGDYWLIYDGYNNEKNTNFTPQKVKILYGGFVFANGEWVVDIMQDPEHYYTGEEFALTIRSYTNGYDLYTPSQIVAWHRAHLTPPKKHFNNNPEEIAHKKHNTAMVQLKKLIEGGDLGRYGIGSIRTLQDYANFAGLDFINKKLLDNI